MRISVLVVPRASKSELAGRLGDAIKVRLAAPPVDGEANAELMETLAKAFGLRKAQIKLAQGLASKRKQIELTGLSPEQERKIKDYGTDARG